MSLDSFYNSSNGYLVDDRCIFGAEVFLLEGNCKSECFSVIKKLPVDGNIITFKIENFSKLDNESSSQSAIHVFGDSKWKLAVYPKAYGRYKGKAVSVFLHLAEADKLPLTRKVYAEYNLRIMSQTNNYYHKQFTGIKEWFSAENASWGYPNFISLKEVHDASKGYIVGDCLIVEAEITLIY